jgi:hypothetical protein
MSVKTGRGSKLPRKAGQAISALLHFPTIEEAAKSIGIAETTLSRWLKDSDFRTAYQ